MSISMVKVNKRKQSLLGNLNYYGVNGCNFIKESTNPDSNIFMALMESKNNVDYLKNNSSSVFSLLELAYKEKLDESFINKMVKYIDNEIIPKIPNLTESNNIVNSSKLPDNVKETFNKSFHEYSLCDRVINNDRKLSNRFNFDKIICENYRKGNKYLVRELCELIDTYDSSVVSTKAKYNVALENINYSFYKNNIDITNEELVSEINDYFLNRDIIISDPEYKGLQITLKNNEFTDLDYLNDVPMTKKYDHTFYSDRLKKISKKCDTSRSKEIIINNLLLINTEKDAEQYINTIFDMVSNDKSLSDNDKDILIKTIDSIPLISSVRKYFVDLQKKKTFGMDPNSFEELFEVADMIDNIIKDTNDIFTEYYIENNKDFYENLLESSDLADSDDIKDLLNRFKQDQNKSPNRFVAMVRRFFTKSPKSIINELPSVLTIVKTVFIFSTIAIPYAGPVIAVILALVNKLITDKITYDETSKLLKTLKNEKKFMKEKLEKESSNDNKKKIEDYIKCIDNCINKLENYIDEIKDSELDSDEDSDFNFDFDDFDLDFDEACSIINTMGEYIEESVTIDKDNIMYNIECSIDELSKDYKTLSEVSKVLANCPTVINIDDYASLLRHAKKELPYMEATNISLLLENLYTFKFKDSDINELSIEMEAFKIIKENLEVLNELSLNDFKLAAKDFQKKLQNLSSKEKNMWHSLDVYSSNLMTNIQRAMTSDRREAIIKGSIIPSLSKCIKTVLAIATTHGVGLLVGAPYLGVITAVGTFATSKYLNKRERQLIYDEIDTELKVVEKQIDLAQNDGDMKQYRFLLTYQKKLTREKQRIKYGTLMKGKNIPMPTNKQ